MLAAFVDDFSPVALEPRDAVVRVFFATPADRDEAQRALARDFIAAPVDVPDDDWARRSQEDLLPVTVGRIVITSSRQSPSPQSPSLLSIVIQPSMGFGTGHHATTRLCLAAPQAVDLEGQDVLDVGTGSGVLAIAAARLGAARAIGIDSDADAIRAARENLALNGEARNVCFEVIDLNAAPLPAADVVTANLTGALLVRSASILLDALRPGGTLILSGILAGERNDVAAAFQSASGVWERAEDEWVGFAVKKS